MSILGTQPNEEFYAHSKEGSPPERWHGLEEHLATVAGKALILHNTEHDRLFFWVQQKDGKEVFNLWKSMK